MPEQAHTEWLDRVYGAHTNEDLTEAYDGWAAEYERDVINFGYAIPAVTTGFFGRFVDAGDGPILDAGCGTGLAGYYLSLLGYRGLVGIDLSQGMLDVAAEKKVFERLERMVLGEPLDFADDHFAAMVATGVFTMGHAPASAFDELVRVTRTGGHLIFSLRADVVDEAGYQAKFDELERAGAWRQVAASPDFPGLPYEDAGLLHRVVAFQTT